MRDSAASRSQMAQSGCRLKSLERVRLATHRFLRTRILRFLGGRLCRRQQLRTGCQQQGLKKIRRIYGFHLHSFHPTAFVSRLISQIFMLGVVSLPQLPPDRLCLSLGSFHRSLWARSVVWRAINVISATSVPNELSVQLLPREFAPTSCELGKRRHVYQFSEGSFGC
jgi:hypothetical protein